MENMRRSARASQPRSLSFNLPSSQADDTTTLCSSANLTGLVTAGCVALHQSSRSQSLQNTIATCINSSHATSPAEGELLLNSETSSNKNSSPHASITSQSNSQASPDDNVLSRVTAATPATAKLSSKNVTSSGTLDCTYPKKKLV